jgi:hypothetical protein
MFGVVLRNFVAARHPFRKRLSGAYKARIFLPPEPFLRFSQRTCPIHYFRSKTHVWGGFAKFRCRTSPILKTVVGVHTKHEFLPPEPFLRFSQRTCPIHYFRYKTHVWGGFAQFRCRTSLISKTSVACIKARVFATGTISSFFATNMPNQCKTHVWGGFAQFCCRTSLIPKTSVGCIKARVFATGTISSFFVTNMPNPLL